MYGTNSPEPRRDYRRICLAAMAAGGPLFSSPTSEHHGADDDVGALSQSWNILTASAGISLGNALISGLAPIPRAAGHKVRCLAVGRHARGGVISAVIAMASVLLLPPARALLRHRHHSIAETGIVFNNCDWAVLQWSSRCPARRQLADIPVPAYKLPYFYFARRWPVRLFVTWWLSSKGGYWWRAVKDNRTP